MSKQNFCLRKGYFNSLVFVLSSSFILLFAYFVMFPSVISSTHAEGDEPDDGISIVVSDSISANVTLFDEGDYKIAKDTVTVSSSAPYGYELFLTTDSEEHQSIYLNDDSTSTSKISPVSGTIDEPATLTSNTWGFAIPGQGNFDDEYSTANPDPASKFAIIPTASNQQAVFENNAATAEDNVDFYYGIKVEPTLEPGEYKTSAEYTAIAKEPPLTAKGILTDDGHLGFYYNRTVYNVGDTLGRSGGEVTITNVYDNIPLDGIEEETFTWAAQSDSIFTASFDRSFYSFRPTNTSKWFRELRKLRSIDLTHFATFLSTDLSYMFDHAGYDVTDSFSVGGELPICTQSANASYLFYYAGYNAQRFSLDGLIIQACSGAYNFNMSHMFDHAAYNVQNYFRPFANSSIWLGTIARADMSYMFAYFGYSAQDEYRLDLPKSIQLPISIAHIFDHAGYSARGAFVLTNLQEWNMNRVEDTSYAFAYAGYTTQQTFDLRDINRWSMDSATNMDGMFYYAGYFASMWLGNFSSWNVSNVINHENFINLNARGSNSTAVNNQPNWRY